MKREQPGVTRRRGFTLMEVLLVLAILGTIMTMVVPKLLGRQEQASVDATRLSIRGLEQSINMFAYDHGGRFPKDKDAFQVLLKKTGREDSKWRGPYLDERPVDAWGNDFRYRYPGKLNPDAFDIISSGPDGLPETDDDISNSRDRGD